MSTRLIVPSKPGDALINAFLAFQNLDELEGDFNVLHFLDLCAGIEAAVLHNSLSYIDSTAKHDFMAKNPIVAALVKGDALTRYIVETPDPGELATRLMAHKNARDLMKIIPSHPPTDDPVPHLSVMAAGIDLLADLGFEAETHVPLAVTARMLPIYLSLPQQIEERRAMQRLKGELAARYADFKAALYALRDQAYQEEHLRIPPIALEVFEIAKSRDEMGTALMEVRHRYRRIREQFTQLDELMQSRSQSPVKILTEQAKLRKSISKLFTKKDAESLASITTLATELNDVVDLKAITDDEVGIDWSKLVATIIKHADDIYWKFRLRPLHASKRRYLELSTKRAFDVVRHHFGHQLTNSDRAAADAYATQVEKLLSSGAQVGAA